MANHGNGARRDGDHSSTFESLPPVMSSKPAAPAPRTPQVDVDPRYRVTGWLGEGSQGMVLAVHDWTLGRDVAMKALHAEDSDPGWARLFVEEAQITAQLEHPNIVPLHDLGTQPNGQPFFTMRRVAGVTFEDWLHEQLADAGASENLSAALEIFLKVCDGLSYAHARGVVHGDLKPSNVMVGGFGEVYVMDWGLAHVLRSERAVDIGRKPGAYRFSAGAIGTPQYMSPEQAAGVPGTIDASSDVFALGAMLYRIVVGRPPFEGSNASAVVEAARRTHFAPPEGRLLGGDVPPAIARVIRKAMHEAKAGRHESVLALKNDVRRAMRGGTHLPRKSFPAGHVFCRQGEIGHEAWVILDGRCRVSKTAADGSVLTLREMGPGTVFGEMALIRASERTATVEALEPVTALVVSHAVLEAELGLDAWVGMFVKALAERFLALESSYERLSDGRVVGP